MKKKIREKLEDLPVDVSKLPGWAKAQTRVDPTDIKIPTRRITINIDSDIIAIFKTEALRGGPPYQVAINQALRAYLRERETKRQAETKEAILLALNDPKVRSKIRSISARAR
ncbi:MAG: BrnA antitoxin family protein [Planctomycetes bacterium]|nr:BrnA antitoxin family protein [Planctomycetota bacterium]